MSTLKWRNYAAFCLLSTILAAGISPQVQALPKEPIERPEPPIEKPAPIPNPSPVSTPLPSVPPQAPQSSTMKVRIELLEVICRDTEDSGLFGSADEFYVMGALSSEGARSNPILTTPFSIDDGQTKPFGLNQRVIFDADVPVGRTVRGGLQAFDEDLGKDWQKYGSMVTQIGNGVAEQLDAHIDPNSVPAGDILRGSLKGFGLFASLDKDDTLGTLELDISADGPPEEVREWNFKKTKSFLGYSNWNYTVRYRILRTPS